MRPMTSPSPLALPSPSALVSLAPLVASTQAYLDAARSSSTRRGYAADMARWESWAREHGASPLPADPAIVAVYLAALADAGKKPSTIARAVAAIGAAHGEAGLTWHRGHPAVAQVMSGIRRKLGTAPAAKAPLEGEALRLLVATLDTSTLAGARDRALLVLGWHGAFRRSELVALDLGDVKQTPSGLVVTVRRGKTDQEGRGLAKGLPPAADPNVCPVRALAAWLAASGIERGPLLRAVDRHGHLSAERLSDRSVARIVQRAARAAGIDPASLAGHSLRSGFATTAARRGKSLDAIMRTTGHRSERVARSYVRLASLFDANAGTGLL